MKSRAQRAERIEEARRNAAITAVVNDALHGLTFGATITGIVGHYRLRSDSFLANMGGTDVTAEGLEILAHRLNDLATEIRRQQMRSGFFGPLSGVAE